MLKCALTILLIFQYWAAQSGQNSPQALSSSEIARRLLPNIVNLVAQDAAGKQFAMGYGFFVDPWTIVTNDHLLKDAKNKNAAMFYIISRDAKFYHVNYISKDLDNRLLFLDVEERGPHPFPLGKKDKLNPGDKVYLIDAGSFAQSHTPGTARLIEMTLPLPPEYSGLPVLDQSGMGLGIAIDPRVKSAPANGVIPTKELADKVIQYLSYNKEAKTAAAKKPTGNSSGSFSGAEGPGAEREAGGQTALQPAEATKTTKEANLNPVDPASTLKALKRVQPYYPQAAKTVRADGTVHVSITVDEQGEVIKAKVVKGHDLLKLSALRAARQWQFVPAMKDGVPVRVTTTQVFNFYLP